MPIGAAFPQSRSAVQALFHSDRRRHQTIAMATPTTSSSATRMRTAPRINESFWFAVAAGFGDAPPTDGEGGAEEDDGLVGGE